MSTRAEREQVRRLLAEATLRVREYGQACEAVGAWQSSDADRSQLREFISAESEAHIAALHALWSAGAAVGVSPTEVNAAAGALQAERAADRAATEAGD